MQPLAVDATLLRAVLSTEVELSAGRELMARVASLGADGRGTLSLAGNLLEAELPSGVSTGDELRLVVREVTPERVTLAIQPDSNPAQIPPLVSAPLVPMPAGGSLQVTERDAQGAQQVRDGVHTLSLRYDAPDLGPVEMSFTLGAGGLQLALTVAPGSSMDAAQSAAPELSDALVRATELPVTLTITQRREPIEVFA
jgi:Flagellar hook-length control protein FliK